MEEQILKIIKSHFEVSASKEITEHIIKFNMWLLNNTSFALVFDEINEENYLENCRYWLNNIHNK
jgi:hypothetical protein